MRKHYLDYAAATPLDPDVFAAMKPYFSEAFFNPSALYLDAQRVKQAVTTARADVASVLGCKPSEVIFTAGGTESDNLAVQGVMQQFPGKNCVISEIEHEAVRKPAEQYDSKTVGVLPDGRVDIDQLEKLIDENTVLISIMYVNNEIGTIQPLQEISKILDRIRSKRRNDGNQLPLYFHTDACQAANYLTLLPHSLGVDLMTLNGGKIYGPKQSGILYIKTGVKLQPQILGGGQERSFRSGTENVVNIVGFAHALQSAQSIREDEHKRLQELQQYAFEQIAKQIPQTVINGSQKHRIANNVHITIPGTDNERLMMELDEQGIMVATGSACSASSDEPSYVLGAIGISDSDARSSLRVTFGRQTTKLDVTTFVTTLAALVAPDAN